MRNPLGPLDACSLVVGDALQPRHRFRRNELLRYPLPMARSEQTDLISSSTDRTGMRRDTARVVKDTNLSWLVSRRVTV